MAQPNDKSVTQIVTQPGIKRDGTSLDGNYYSDGLWCRFRNGRPKKIGGFREIANNFSGPVRGVHVFANYPYQIVTSFSQTGIECLPITKDGVAGGAIYDRTPAGFTPSSDFTWQYDTLYDINGLAIQIIAHAGHNLVNIDQTVQTPIYYGDATSNAALVTTGVSVSGGICILQPFLFAYDFAGTIKNTALNNVTDWSTGDANTAHVAGTKIVKGLPMRGGSASPAGLFWALDALIRVTYAGGTVKWKYDTVGATTIISPNAVVDYDGVFFWPGVDRFLMYNGVIKEVPNSLNQDFFFDNYTRGQEAKIWATKLPRWGEIWWFFPKYPATEVNWAVVYNYRENCWYDTPVYRSAGYPPQVLNFPVWADSATNTRSGATKYSLFQHEYQFDSIIGVNVAAIESYFETSDLGIVTGSQRSSGNENPNVQTRITRVEPDFVQTGAMSVAVTGSSHAEGADDPTPALPFGPSTANPETVDFRAQRRLLRLKFSSNVQGGNYHMGKILMHLEPGDPRE